MKHIQLPRRDSFTSRAAPKFGRSTIMVLAVLIFGGIGTVGIIHSHATTPTTSVIAANGTLSANAKVVNDASASQGNAVEFNSPSRLLIPSTGSLLGVSTSSTTASGIADLESGMGRHFDVDVNFWSFSTKTTSNITPSILADDKANDRIPIVTWQPDLAGNPADIMPDITAGNYDAYIKSVADQLKAYDKPIFLRFGHEMNGNWYSWSGCQNGCSKAGADAYVAAWRHVYDMFQQDGVTNVLWVWCAAPNDVPSGVVGHHWTDYYPGDAYVDWISYDTYFSPNSYTATGANNTPTAEDITKTWANSEGKTLMGGMKGTGSNFYTNYNMYTGTMSRKPIFIAETMNGPDLDDSINQLIANGSLDVSTYDKTKYFSTIVPDLKQFPGIKGVAFFDHYTDSAGNSHDYCLNEQDCHPQQWNSTTLPTPNATSSAANFAAFVTMTHNCYLDTNKLQTACR